MTPKTSIISPHACADARAADRHAAGPCDRCEGQRDREAHAQPARDGAVSRRLEHRRGASTCGRSTVARMRMRARSWCAVGWVIFVFGCGGDVEAGIDAATDAAARDARVEPLDAEEVDDAALGVDAGTHPDIVRMIDVVGREPGGGWSDSYSVGDQCYCESTFDHDIGAVVVATPGGPRTVREVCDALGPGPGSAGRPIYNDIQCGNGPANDAGDEDDCPGRVDLGREGCGHIGPTWDLSVVFAE